MTVTPIIINGAPYEVELSTLPSTTTLNTFIREYAQLTATKFMCLEGGCGACIVSIKRKHPVTGEVITNAANSCLTLLNSCVNSEITTCEGIGNKLTGYHPIQQRMAKMNATQCGFCSPGFVMNMYSLLEYNGNKVTMKEVENAFGGNLCRCTGYRPILDAMKSFAYDNTADIPTECCDIEDLTIKKCPKNGNLCQRTCHETLEVLPCNDGSKWYYPKDMSQLFEILSKMNSNNEYMLAAGNTAHGVYRRSEDIKHFIDINAIADLKKHDLSQNKMYLGANLSLSEAMNIFVKASKEPGFEYCQQLWQHFDLIANVPVRNMGTLAGNISIKKMHNEFTSDVFITFEALNVRVVVATETAKRETVALADYLKWKASRSVIVAFELPAYPNEKYYFRSYKVMPRAQNAHSYVNAAFLLFVEMSTGKVSSARLCFGGIRPDFVHATSTEGLLKSQRYHDRRVVMQIFSELPKVLQPDDVLPEASPEFCRKLVCGLMLKFLLEISPAEKVRPEYKSGGLILHRGISSGTQTFYTDKKKYPVTQPVQKIEALIQCSGEATYVNDIITSCKAVHCAFVKATMVGATIEHIDASDALNTPGVVAFLTAKDIPGINSFVDPIFSYETEEIFCSGVVLYYDQPLGVIAAVNSDTAYRAASKVKVIYSYNDNNVMATIPDVFAINQPDRIQRIATSDLEGNCEFITADLSANGIFELGPQYHFTMELQTCIVIPYEQAFQVWSSTQCMNHTQSVIAKMLNIKVTDVQLTVPRLGGAYGGKVSYGNQIACAAALIAHTLNTPARFVQTIESMMSCNGKRWACYSDYEFHVMANGKISRLKNKFYEDAGCTLNENPIANHTLTAARNCYALNAKNFELDGNAVITDAPSSTWCRAPGSLEGIAMMENIIEHIAFETNLDAADVRMINLQSGNKMRDLLPAFLESRQYKKRRQEIDAFNLKNRWIKRGLGLAIMQYTTAYMGPYPATVSIYHSDGSVVVSHGGIEMGQGLNTKVIQTVAFILGIPLEHIKVEGSNTVNGANSFESAASIGSESFCYAVRKACNVLNDRLQPFRDSLGSSATLQQVAHAAWLKSINLIASEAFQVGDMTNYNVYGLALTEVKVDILTGNLIVVRVDILEDCGKSISPYIDIGQVEGAFIMSLGYWLTEKLVYDRITGRLVTNRTWNYKPPGAKDIPIDFRVELLQGSNNPGGFMSSKGTGEPPCCLGVSVLPAIQQAVQSARSDAGLPRKWVRLEAPTTAETIVLNAGNDVARYSIE